MEILFAVFIWLTLGFFSGKAFVDRVKCSAYEEDYDVFEFFIIFAFSLLGGATFVILGIPIAAHRLYKYIKSKN